MTTPDTERGLYAKYQLYRIRPRPAVRKEMVHDPFFVLRYTTDLHARAAIAAYADSCEHDYPQLAADLRGQLAAVSGTDKAEQ